MTIVEAYAICASIAQREAKNFYYAFRVLPEHKRNAMCAVYAFMRRADDISDDESLSIAQRRDLMHQWLAAWRCARGGTPTDDPIFKLLGSTCRRLQSSARVNLGQMLPVFTGRKKIAVGIYAVGSMGRRRAERLAIQGRAFQRVCNCICAIRFG